VNETEPPEIVPAGGIPPAEEVVEVVELIVEFRENRRPRPGRAYHVLIDEAVVDFRHDHALAEEMLRRVGKDTSEGWVLYEVIHGKEGRLEPDQTVHFRRHGLERFHTRQETVWVIVNGRRKEVHGHRLTFEQVVALAFPTAPPGENIIYTVAYRNGGDPKHPEGSLIAGASVKIKDGTIFDVTATDKS
jgi:hypothetical protein